jgi:hypothetical protein
MTAATRRRISLTLRQSAQVLDMLSGSLRNAFAVSGFGQGDVSNEQSLSSPQKCVADQEQGAVWIANFNGHRVS